jgi:hypothetical protein
MDFLQRWFAEKATGWGRSIVAAVVAAILAVPIVSAAIALLRGLIEIAVDLVRTFEGRIVLGLVAGLSAAWILADRYTVVERGQIAAFEQRIEALSKRPESCAPIPVCSTKGSKR